MASMLYRQESEVANELKLALEEACLELGVSLSNAFSPSALWLFDANNGDPALADLASWVNITRRRSYRPSPLNKYRKYSLPSLDDAETSEKELEERVEVFRFAATSTDLLGTEPISDFHQFRAHIEAQRTNPHNTQVLSCVWKRKRA